MRVVIFLGPTLAHDAASRELEATYLPPVAQGDVYRVARDAPWAIGIVDGFFHNVPSVWHKEILWALSRGIWIFGSASMGALRAAELEPFGMQGVGRIFDDFRSRRLEDDDEVALVHGSKEADFRPLSEPMVHLRYTFEAAQLAGVIQPTSCQRLIDIAKRLHYPQRSFEATLAGARSLVPAVELGRLSTWLEHGRVDQKREDAVSMLRRIAELRRRAEKPPKNHFVFQSTDAWLGLCKTTSSHRGPMATTEESPQGWLDELRLLGVEAYHLVSERAQARLGALELDELQASSRSDPAAVFEATARFCRRRHLDHPDSLERWIEDNNLGRSEFYQLMEEEARLYRRRMASRSRLASHLETASRLYGDHTALEKRSLAKRRELMARGQLRPSLGDLGLGEDELWQWHFARLGIALPADLDGYAQSLDLTGADELRRIVLRDWCFCQPSDATQARPSDAGPLTLRTTPRGSEPPEE